MNYQKELDHIIERIEKENKCPSLLIHSCCAPCSSYVLEYLSKFFKITIFYYNPNIYPELEYQRRAEEQRSLIQTIDAVNSIELIQGDYHPEIYYNSIKGLEQEPEGGKRCFRCYEIRLREAARVALEGNFDYFTTTLSISPHKNAEKLNEIGLRIGDETGVTYLVSDFKKKNGYKRSIELSKEYGLYRQDYCGCIFSKNNRENFEKAKGL